MTDSASSLTHLDERGAARMVDVSDKGETVRTAVAEGWVRCSVEAREALRRGQLDKGDALAVARVAGIAATKQTASLIPLCHPLPLSHVAVDITSEEAGIRIRCTVRCVARTGAEMEALTGVTVACLTLVDMLKAVDHWCIIDTVGLLHKSGGRSGTIARPR